MVGSRPLRSPAGCRLSQRPRRGHRVERIIRDQTLGDQDHRVRGLPVCQQGRQFSEVTAGAGHRHHIGPHVQRDRTIRRVIRRGSQQVDRLSGTSQLLGPHSGLTPFIEEAVRARLGAALDWVDRNPRRVLVHDRAAHAPWPRVVLRGRVRVRPRSGTYVLPPTGTAVPIDLGHQVRRNDLGYVLARPAGHWPPVGIPTRGWTACPPRWRPSSRWNRDNRCSPAAAPSDPTDGRFSSPPVTTRQRSPPTEWRRHPPRSITVCHSRAGERSEQQAHRHRPVVGGAGQVVQRAFRVGGRAEVGAAPGAVHDRLG